MRTTIAILFACALAACGGASHSTHARVDAAASLAARRAQAIQWLHDYREAGVFPTDARGLPIGVFRDAHGVRCPMSELIYRSGRADLVDAVATTDNRLRLADVHDGPVFDWMLASGLTQEEAIMVQGAMSWQAMGNLKIENGANLNQVRIVARDAVVKKLAAAELELRAGTAASLKVAGARLEAHPQADAAAHVVRVGARAVQPQGQLAGHPARPDAAQR